MTAAIKQGLARGLLCALGIALALTLTEVALRLVPLPDLRLVSVFQLPPDTAWKNAAWDDPPASVYRRQRVVGWEHAPAIDLSVALAEHRGGSFRFKTNNLGLRRDADTAVARSADLFRVLVL